MNILNDVENFNKQTIEKLFEIFKRDFILNDTYLKKDNIQFLIDVKKNITCPCPFGGERKPERFWHLITNKKSNSRHKNPCPFPENERKYDVARAKRIHWIKIIIDNWQNDEHIKYFYEKINGKETLHIWHTKYDFLILIRKESNNSNRFLVSTFLIYKNQKHRYKNRLKRYEKSYKKIDWF
jgi:TusA-related sulfurtransferase